MEYKEYNDRKLKGLVNIIKAGGGVAITSKQFDSETGVQKENHVEALDATVLLKRKVELQKEISAIDVMLTDINNVQNVVI